MFLRFRIEKSFIHDEMLFNDSRVQLSSEIDFFFQGFFSEVSFYSLVLSRKTAHLLMQIQCSDEITVPKERKLLLEIYL